MFLSHGMQTVWLSECGKLCVYSMAHAIFGYSGLVPLCSSTIFTLEYNFTASQIVRSSIIYYIIHA